MPQLKLKAASTRDVLVTPQPFCLSPDVVANDNTTPIMKMSNPDPKTEERGKRL